MGDVIEFRLVAANGRSRRRSVELSGDCRVMLFTGVRYERHPEADARPADAEGPATGPTGSSKPRVGAKRRKKQA